MYTNKTRKCSRNMSKGILAVTCLFCVCADTFELVSPFSWTLNIFLCGGCLGLFFFPFRVWKNIILVERRYNNDLGNLEAAAIFCHTTYLVILCINKWRHGNKLFLLIVSYNTYYKSQYFSEMSKSKMTWQYKILFSNHCIFHGEWGWVFFSLTIGQDTLLS